MIPGKVITTMTLIESRLSHHKIIQQFLITLHMKKTFINVYTPKDKRRIPVREALESKPKAVRPILKISWTIISLSNLIKLEKNRTLEIWNNPTNYRIFENTEQNLDVLETYQIHSNKKTSTLNFDLASLQVRTTKKKLNSNFEQAKNRSRISSSKYAKKIAKLKLKSTIERRDQDIIKQFLLMLTQYVTYH